jgi:polysaccharide export outer membrane protein
MQGTLIRAERRERDETTRSMEKRMKLPLARSLACLAILALSATGCVSTVGIDAKRGVPGEMQQFTAELPPYPDVATLMGTEPLAPYRVGPLDGLSVQVFGRPDLGSQKETEQGRVSTVGEDGRIHLPLLGRLEVAGLTRDEIAQLVSQRYARMVENAQVEVQIQDCGSVPVDLAGAFVREGRYYLCENLRTVGDVLRAAEGLTEEANPARGTLSRGGVTYRLDAPSVLLEGDASRFDVALERGDILHFPVVGEQQVFVFGQVAAPGPYPIPPQGLTLVELLALAEGWDEETTSQSVYLLRPTDEMVVAFRIDLGDLLQGPRVPVMDGDRLYVAPTRLARWSWWWRQAIPSFFLPRYSL